jgi:hypothetical protein
MTASYDWTSRFRRSSSRIASVPRDRGPTPRRKTRNDQLREWMAEQAATTSQSGGNQRARLAGRLLELVRRLGRRG